MSLRFRKSFKVAPGVKLNLNKKSVSVTFGRKGFHHTINSNGRKTTSVGIPGTGLYYQNVSTFGNSHSFGNSSTTNNQQYYNNNMNYSGGDKNHNSVLLWFLLLFIPPVGLIYLWTNKPPYSRRKRTILSAIFGFYAIYWICAFTSGSDNNTSDTALVQEQTTTAVQSELQSTVSTTTIAIENTTAIIEFTTETATEPDIIVAQENEETAEPEVEPKTEAVTEPETEPTTERTTAERKVWIDDTGKRYHIKSSCSNMDAPYQVPLSEAEQRGYTPCKKCYK